MYKGKTHPPKIVETQIHTNLILIELGSLCQHRIRMSE